MSHTRILCLTSSGVKIRLNFEVGAGENAVVSIALEARLQRCGFDPSPGCRLFAVFDGAAALEAALLALVVPRELLPAVVAASAPQRSFAWRWRRPASRSHKPSNSWIQSTAATEWWSNGQYGGVR
jgi:hypothetical protein